MLNIYTKDNCPFCVTVEDYLLDKGIPFIEKNVQENEEFLNELIEQGGKRQVPFLIDDEKGISMYESDAIMEYAEKKA